MKATVAVLTVVATLCGCSSPTTHSGAVAKTFPNNCSALDTEHDDFFEGLSTIQCVAASEMALAPDSSIHGGVFTSTDGAASLSVPEFHDAGGHPGAQVWENTGAPPVSKILVTPMPADGLIYTAYPLHWNLFATPKTLGDLEDRFLNNPNFAAQMMIGSPRVERLYSANTVLADGSPAKVEVYRQTAFAHVADFEHQFQIFYLIKSDSGYSILSIFLSKSCPVCSSGPEADIRNVDPHIAAFVDSYRRYKLAQK